MTSTGTAGSYGPVRLAVAGGDVMAVDTDVPADARHLLRILATLERADGGDYRFNGVSVDTGAYRRCLAVKRQIGYVAADAALISNRTLRENLLLTRYYHENDLTIEIDEAVAALLENAGLIGKLDRRPADLSGGERFRAIAIREVAKSPAVMLIEQPAHVLNLTRDEEMFRHLVEMVGMGTAVVFYSPDRTMMELANRRLTMAGGAFRTGAV